MRRFRMSKTDYERHLLSIPGWWNDPVWGVARGKTFREWSNRNWQIHKGKRGPSNKRIGVEEYNRRIDALRKPPARQPDTVYLKITAAVR